jgi:predicted ATPase
MEARQIDHAIGYWLKAGERAAQRSANLEAIRHLSRGLEALQTLPDSLERDRRDRCARLFRAANGCRLQPGTCSLRASR